MSWKRPAAPGVDWRPESPAALLAISSPGSLRTVLEIKLEATRRADALDGRRIEADQDAVAKARVERPKGGGERTGILARVGALRPVFQGDERHAGIRLLRAREKVETCERHHVGDSRVLAGSFRHARRDGER